MYASTAFLMLQWRSGSLQKMLCGFPVLHHPNCQPFSQSPPSSLLAILALYIVALKYLITVHTYWKTPFHMACKEGQFDVVQ